MAHARGLLLRAVHMGTQLHYAEVHCFWASDTKQDAGLQRSTIYFNYLWTASAPDSPHHWITNSFQSATGKR